MKPFSLEEYLKDPSRKVVTREGRDVRILCADRKSSDNFPVVALIKDISGNEWAHTYTSEGEFLPNRWYSEFDLFFADENPQAQNTQAYWISVDDDLPCNHKDLINPSDKRTTLAVLACVKDKNTVYFANMEKTDGIWKWEEDFTTDYDTISPTHWMPISTLPK